MSARCTSSSERAATRLGPASASQRRARKPSTTAVRSSSPPSATAPAIATTSPSNPTTALPIALRLERAGDTAGDARSSRGDLLERVATAERALPLGQLNHCSTVPTGARRRQASGIGPSYDLLGARSSEIGPRMDHKKTEKPRISRAL
jgi:hypothetical protein